MYERIDNRIQEGMMAVKNLKLLEDWKPNLQFESAPLSNSKNDIEIKSTKIEIDEIKNSPAQTRGKELNGSRNSLNKRSSDILTLKDWIPDKQMLKCKGCGVKFGFFVRKHHCKFFFEKKICSFCSTKADHVDKFFVMHVQNLHIKFQKLEKLDYANLVMI